MRGADSYNEALFSTVKLDEFVPASQPHAAAFLGRIASAVREMKAKTMEIAFPTTPRGQIQAGIRRSARKLSTR